MYDPKIVHSLLSCQDWDSLAVNYEALLPISLLLMGSPILWTKTEFAYLWPHLIIENDEGAKELGTTFPFTKLEKKNTFPGKITGL